MSFSCDSKNASRATLSCGVSPSLTTCLDFMSTSAALPVFGWNVQSPSDLARMAAFFSLLRAACSCCRSRKEPLPPRTPSSAIISHSRRVFSLSLGAKEKSPSPYMLPPMLRLLERVAVPPPTDARRMSVKLTPEASLSNFDLASTPASSSKPRAIALLALLTLGAKVRSGFSSSTCTRAAANASCFFRSSSPTRSCMGAYPSASTAARELSLMAGWKGYEATSASASWRFAASRCLYRFSASP
mmetsp:Transcript_10166/g.46552  ORF Transcript_10166/g.46552 Transcript_10166/m.46552 type:complete len:244 (+) Transcript_10166:158-889(+)